MKIDWQTKKLSEVCDFSNGLWKGKKPPYINVGVIRNTNITREGKLDDSDIAYLEVEEKQYSKRSLHYGDIILEKSGGGPKQPVGRVIIFDKKDGDFSFSNFTSALRVKNPKELDFNFLHKFLFYSYISGVTEGMQSNSTGIRNLDMNTYKEVELPIPSLNEQKRIVKILDEAFDKIAKAKENAEKNLQNSNDIFESYLNTIFTNPSRDHETKQLGDIADVEYGYTDKAQSTGDYRFVRITDTDEYGLLTVSNKMYVKDFKDSSKYLLAKGDLLMARTGASAGNLMFFNSDEKAVFASYLIRIRMHKYIAGKLYWFFSKSRPYWDQVRLLSAGAAQPQFNGGALKQIVITFPRSLDEQKKIIKKLEEISEQTKKLEENYKQKIADLEELKKSLLTKAFAGEL